MAEIAATAETVAVDFEQYDDRLFAVGLTGLTGVSRALMERREAEELMFQMVEILGYKLELES